MENEPRKEFETLGEAASRLLAGMVRRANNNPAAGGTAYKLHGVALVISNDDTLGPGAKQIGMTQLQAPGLPGISDERRTQGGAEPPLANAVGEWITAACGE